MTELEANAKMLNRLDRIVELLGELASREHSKPRRLLRLVEGAHYLHISIGQLRNLIQRGEIDVIRQSNGSRIPWLVDRADLDRWVEKSKVTNG